jgi:hypothetical protein
MRRIFCRAGVVVAMTIYCHEAVLTCPAIIVWHFDHVIFNPDVYPLNPARLNGRISGELQAHDHPLEPPAGDEDDRTPRY